MIIETEWRVIADIWIAGKPMRQPRPYVGRRGTFTPETKKGELKAWKKAITLTILTHRLDLRLACPVKLEVKFILFRSKKKRRNKDPDGECLHIATPDVDNLVKALMDTMTKSDGWDDDCQVCDCRIRKYYSAKDGKLGAQVTISVPAETNQLELKL